LAEKKREMVLEVKYVWEGGFEKSHEYIKTYKIWVYNKPANFYDYVGDKIRYFSFIEPEPISTLV
jgi:hypothetical protein